MTLALATATPTARRVAPPSRPSLALARPPATARLLVVDDDPSVAELLEHVLTRQGYQVAVATSGTTALRRGLHEDFAAVVLDLVIPAPNGIEVLHQLRAAGSNVPVVLLTGRSNATDRLAAIRAGADAYLAKPVSAATLTARLHALTTTQSAPRHCRVDNLREISIRGGAAPAADPARSPRRLALRRSDRHDAY